MVTTVMTMKVMIMVVAVPAAESGAEEPGGTSA